MRLVCFSSVPNQWNPPKREFLFALQIVKIVPLLYEPCDYSPVQFSNGGLYSRRAAARSSPGVGVRLQTRVLKIPRKNCITDIADLPGPFYVIAPHYSLSGGCLQYGRYRSRLSWILFRGDRLPPDRVDIRIHFAPAPLGSLVALDAY